MPTRTPTRKPFDLRTKNPQGRIDALAAHAVEELAAGNPFFGMALNFIRPTLHRELRRNLGPRALPDLNEALRQARQPQQHPMPGKPEPKYSRADALATLGLTEPATEEQIKTAYRAIARQYHPDLVAKLAPDFQKLAEEKLKDLNRAHEFLKGAR